MDKAMVQIRVSLFSIGVIASILLHGFAVLGIVYSNQFVALLGLDGARQIEAPLESARLISPEEYFEAMGNPRIVETEFVSQPDLDLKKAARYAAERRQRVQKETRVEGDGSIAGRQPLRLNPSEIKPQIEGWSGKSTGAVSRNQGPNSQAGLNYGSMDQLDEDIVIGPQTILNTDEYVYASFYNRLRRQLQPRWEPLIRRALSQRPELAAKAMYRTNTTILVNQSGRVSRVLINKSSGIKQFDLAASQAIRELPVLRNLPESLLNEQGLYEMKMQFGIHINKGLFKIFSMRQQDDEKRRYLR